MAKKKQVKSTRYKSFRLQGTYSKQSVATWMLVDLVIGFVLGFLLQPTIVSLITSYAAQASY